MYRYIKEKFFMTQKQEIKDGTMTRLIKKNKTDESERSTKIKPEKAES